VRGTEFAEVAVPQRAKYRIEAYVPAGTAPPAGSVAVGLAMVRSVGRGISYACLIAAAGVALTITGVVVVAVRRSQFRQRLAHGNEFPVPGI
jgi:hypothetical protein